MKVADARERAGARRFAWPAPRPRPPSATTPSISRNTSPTRATSRSRCSPTATATSSISASATARCSAATRRCWRRRPRRRSTPSSARDIGEIAADGDAQARLPQRRHDRVPLRGRRVLLHRDEHPPAGRASGHRGDHRHRPRARADPHRRRRAAGASPRRTSRSPATPSSAASTPRTPTPSRPRPARSPTTTRRAASACASIRALYAGYRVPPYYDSLIAKLIVHGTQPQRMPDAPAPRARGIRDRRHRDHASRCTSGIIAAAGLHQRRLRHPLAGALRRPRAVEADAVAAQPHDGDRHGHAAELLLRAYAVGVFPMAESRRRPDALLDRPGAARRPAARPLPRRPPPARAPCASDPLRDPLRHRLRRRHRGCAAPDRGRAETWINERDPQLYRALFDDRPRPQRRDAGATASWSAGSTASRSAAPSSARACSAASTDASKVALVHLVARLKPAASAARHPVRDRASAAVRRRRDPPRRVPAAADPRIGKPAKFQGVVSGARGRGVLAVEHPDVVDGVLERRERRTRREHPAGELQLRLLVGKFSTISRKAALSGVSSGGRLSQWRGVIFRLPKVIVVPTGTSTRDTRAEILSRVSRITVS